MAVDKNITIKFVADGDKRLIKAFEGLAKGQKKFNGQNKKGADGLKKYRKNQMRVTKGNQALGGSFAVIRSKMLLFNFAMALGVRQVIGFVKEASKVDSMSRAFNTLAGATENSQVALSKLKSATNDTMSEFDLFQQANNAMILGVSKNSDEMAEMFDIAQRLGRALGRDTKSSVESLITGIGRQSRLMLDNIGIIVKADEAYGKYAEKLGTTADKLTDAQKKQAFLSATMESARKKVASLGEETLSTEDKIAQMDTAISEAANHLGKLATPIFLGFAEVISDIAKGVQLIGTTELERLIIKLEEVGASDDLIKGLKVDALNEELVGLNSTLESMIGENAFKEMGGDIQLAQKVMQGMVDKAKENIKLGHEDIAYLKESGTLTEERASKMRQFIKEDEFRIKQSNDVLAVIRQILAVETLLAPKNKQKIEEIDITTLAFRNQSNALDEYAISLVKTNNITADYSDNLIGLARAFKISAIAQEQQKNSIVSSSFATGKAYDNAGRAAEAAGKQVIQSLIQQAVVSLMADSFKKLGWLGVPLAATAGAVVGSLVGQAGRHWNMDKFEDGGLVGGRRHSQGGTMIEAEQGEFVMSRNAVNAVGIEAMNRINAGGGAGSVNISFAGNVMSQDFIEDEAIPMIKEAIRRGADIGVS